MKTESRTFAKNNSTIYIYIYIYIYIRKSLEGIANCSLSENSWKQATLPIRLGGLRLREACRSAPASYLASCNSTRQLICWFHSLLPQLKVSFFIVNEHTFPGEQVAHERLCQSIPDTALKTEMTSQKSLQSRLDSDLSSSLKDSASIRDRARLNTISGQHAGAWLQALPNLSLGLAMPSKEFIVALRVWLGIPIFNLPSDVKRCTCGAIIDKFGDHVLGCNQSRI